MNKQKNHNNYNKIQKVLNYKQLQFNRKVNKNKNNSNKKGL